jgi:ATP-dependent RNA helicase DHX33
LNEIFSRDVSIVVGETGSGKTTQLPQYLADDSRFKGCVCVTQPRRVAAVTVASRIAAEMGQKVGEDRVGYCVRFDEKSTPHALIRVLTDGMLMREMMIDPKLRRYSVVILDEAHERSLQTDILMALLKQLQRARVKEKEKLRIVIMSATLNPGIFLGFFGLDESSILFVEGRQYPVRIMYTKEPVEDWVDGALQAVLYINDSEPPGDVLVFLVREKKLFGAKKVV